MGRRALPKLDASIDFSRYIREVESLADPFDPQSLFPVPQDLEFEIGSGKGHFLLTDSQNHPHRNYLGNEIAHRYAKFAAYRLAKHGRENAIVLRGDGLKLLGERMPSECAIGIHIYFPDPWWKERHRRRRVIQPDSILDIQRILLPGGIFHFWTDVGQYFEETCQWVTAHSSLSGPLAVQVQPPAHEMDYRTHFERRMRINQHEVFRAQFKK